ncbi:MAG: NUDIX hydrolase, partial [Solibacillus isronensis]
ALIYEFPPHKQSGDYDENAQHGLHLIFECTLKNHSVPKLPKYPDPNQTAVKWIPIEELDSILLLPNITQQIKNYINNRRNIELIEDYRLEKLYLK